MHCYSLPTTKKECVDITGGTGKPSKMPGLSIGLSANGCNVGSRLAKIEGSVCFDCYALKGQYQFRNVKEAHARRLDGIYNIRWTPAMVQLIKRQSHFRWHDAGDLQSESHLIKICAVAMLTPNVKHWLPTREYRMVTDYTDQITSYEQRLPSNLVIRLSAHKVNGPPPTELGFPTSTVVTDDSATCPARFQDNSCGDCRNCWDTSITHVSYHKH